MEINNDVKLFKQFQASPIFFIFKMWELVPQPIKKVYQQKADDLIQAGNFAEIKDYFFEPFLKGKHITWQQWLILLAIERALRGEAVKRISVASGHGIGKSCVLSWIIIWFLFCFKDAQVPCTAPTADQMHDILWKELKIWLNKMPKEISNLYDWSTGYLRIVESPETWFARAKTAKKENPEALAGVHGDFVLFIIDEASGVVEEVFNVGEGALTGENVLVAMISNPTRSEGYFYDSHHGDSNNWQILQFDSEESPIVDPDFIKRIIEKHGKDSDEYRIRVKGLFPKEGTMDDKGYVPLIDKQQISLVEKDDFVGKKRMGIDPSGEGDDQTIWIVRDNFHARVAAKENTSNSKTIAQKTITLLEYLKISPDDITLDNFGVGANVAAEIAIASKGKIQIKAVNWAEKPEDEDIYANKRAECYYRAREWFIKGGTTDNDLLRDEFSKIKAKRNIQGKKQIMEKTLLKREMKKSPDRADAFALTFYKKDEPEAEPYQQEEEKPLYSEIGV